MSSELKLILKKIAEEDYEHEEMEFEKAINRYRSLLIEIAEAKKIDITVSVEGTSRDDLKGKIHDFKTLERAKLVKGTNRYTHRNEYRQYKLTRKGAEVAEKFLRENQSQT